MNHRICLFLPALGFGGAERVMLNLAEGLVAEGLAVDLCVARAQGEFEKLLPGSVCLVNLASDRPLTSVPQLARYIRREKPAAVIASMTHTGFAALFARAFARTAIPVVIRQESTWSKMAAHMRGRHRLLNPLFAGYLLPKADHLVAVSNGVSRDLVNAFNLSPKRVSVIANPVLNADFSRSLRESPPHPWLAERNEKVPVFVSAGRFVHAKGFDLLIDAFHLFSQRRPARLILFGDGPDRAKLEAKIESLNLVDKVCLPGYTNKLPAAMVRADAFVLSSRWEGLAIVLIEALAAGTRIVATDCPSGPREVLNHGGFGSLVPPEDVGALADGLSTVLDQPKTKPPELDEWLAPYTIAQSTRAHLRVLQSIGAMP
ncbi:MAG: glycosyltransferase [Methylothermaceae bacterium]|nr:glycosyltransferase [Methylothermaceae bacterium]